VLPRIVMLASGSGTLLQSVLDAVSGGLLPATISAVGTDVADCGALERAAWSEVPSFVCAPSDFPTRDEWNDALLDHLRAYEPDWIVSAGFMRILGPAVVDAYAGRILNTHPALLPAFPGAHAVRDALAYGVTVTGCTVHVVDRGVDTGPILAQVAVPVVPDDTEETLHERIKEQERTLLVSTLSRLIGEPS
jgi:phosphoribosylglycinamide formyltransferase-1